MLSHTLAVLALFFACGVVAAAADDRRTCLPGGYAAAADIKREEACARFIQSGRARGKELANAYASRALSMSQRGDYASALQEYNEAMRLAPDNVTLRADRGGVYINIGDYDRALVDLDDALRQNPKDSIGHFLRGKAYLLKRDYDHSIADYSEAIRLDPKGSGAYYWRGRAHFGKLDYDRAIEDFTAALKRETQDTAVASVYFALCQVYSTKHDYDRALADCDEGTRRAPTTGWGSVFRCMIYVLKSDYDRALPDCDEGLRRLPDSTDTYLWRCDVYGAKGDTDRALRDCDEYVRRAPKSGAGYARRCELYAARGESDRALSECDESIRKLPNGISAYAFRGLLYEQKGDLAKAAADYQKALASDLIGKATFHVPRAIGTTLDDVRTHLASLQESMTRKAAPPVQGDARAILEKHGLLGVWAADCGAAASPQNAYTVYRALDQRRVQRDVMIGPAQRSEAGIIEVVTDAGNDVIYTQAGEMRDATKLRVNGSQMRVVEFDRNGTKMIADGVYLAGFGGAVAGQPTAWASKCQ